MGEGLPASSAHDINEVAPGIVLTSSRPIMVLDARKDPRHSKLLAVGDDERITGGIHSNRWPRKAKDKKEIVYAVDYSRGIDILRYTDKP